MTPLPFRFFLNNPLLQALGLEEEKPGKEEHRHQHKGAQHHQPHVAAVGEGGPGWLLCRDHVGQVQHVAQGPTCITAANLKQKSRISAGGLPMALPHQWHPWGQRARLCGRSCRELLGLRPPHHKPHLSKEVNPLPVIFSEFIAVFQEREDVGSREAIFTQVLFFDVVVSCLHLGKKAITFPLC